jgi:hypothetical protein
MHINFRIISLPYSCASMIRREMRWGDHTPATLELNHKYASEILVLHLKFKMKWLQYCIR